MRPISRAFILAVALLSMSFISTRAEVSITFGGILGVYTLPSEITGYIDGGASTDNRFIWAESGTDDYGYISRTYRYEHPFPLKTLPNAGLNLTFSVRFPNRMGFFLEGCRTFSILEKEIDQSAADTLPADQYAIIPNDYRVRTTASNDRLYTKSFLLGLGLLYAIPIKDKIRLIIAGSFGRAYYSQYFRIETIAITTDYYQNDGHRVYTETDNQGSFDVFGIRYSAYYFKPAILTEWDLRSPLSVKLGLAYPLSLIEQGYHFTQNDEFNQYASVFYPSRRFVAGNVMLSVGASLNFGQKGGEQQ
jgi:hypothetical protein